MAETTTTILSLYRAIIEAIFFTLLASFTDAPPNLNTCIANILDFSKDNDNIGTDIDKIQFENVFKQKTAQTIFIFAR